jgi:hypothetical protein
MSIRKRCITARAFHQTSQLRLASDEQFFEGLGLRDALLGGELLRGACAALAAALYHLTADCK